MSKVIIFIIFLLLSAEVIQAEERKSALIIGNSDYKELPSLWLPKRDVDDVRHALMNIGFSVTVRTNTTHRDMIHSIRDFTHKAEKDEIILLFYSGHWASYEGNNYLVPIDAKLKSKNHLRYEAISLKEVIHYIEETNGIKIALFDFPGNLVNRYTAKLNQTWYRPERIPNDMLISFSSQPKGMPCDFSERKNPYVNQLIRLLNEANLHLGDLFKRLAYNVQSESNGCQAPWFESTLTRDVYLNSRKPLPCGYPGQFEIKQECGKSE